MLEWFDFMWVFAVKILRIQYDSKKHWRDKFKLSGLYCCRSKLLPATVEYVAVTIKKYS